MKYDNRVLFLAEFPNFDAPSDMFALLALPGFTDASWHNDICPSVASAKHRIWCDYANAELSEYGTDRGAARFTIHGISSADDLEPTDDGTHFDTLAELLAHVAALNPAA
jgi:hypothetical protein